jgi:hypothetical protein
MTGFFVTLIVALIALGYTMGNSATASLQVTVNPASSVKPNATGSFHYASDGSLTGLAITNDPATWPGTSPQFPNGNVWNICTAVALAEGYNQGVGTAPYDLNNPGDLSPGDEAGQTTCGPSEVHGGSAIILFCTAENGFIALYDKFERIVTGLSNVYPVTDTWAQVAAKYAGNSAAWLANVTNYLGVDPQSTPASYVAA